MCMALIPEWNGSAPGWDGCDRRAGSCGYGAGMEKMGKIPSVGKGLGTVLLGIVGALLLGVGMCLTMVWSNMILGIVIGIVGIVVLLCLIPLTKGLK